MKELICIVCPRGCHLTVDENNGYAVTGNFCKRGEVYGKAEVTAPVRVVTSTVAIHRASAKTAPDAAGGIEARCPVKTSDAIPKHLVLDAMQQIYAASVDLPVHIGDVVIHGICGTGADLVATKDILA
ncbi:MAG: DUF1667 domain-containing protein [Clostridia bacterium]|nr:DUF1667 domain-containing protein [Clostridia bacterium]